MCSYKCCVLGFSLLDEQGDLAFPVHPLSSMSLVGLHDNGRGVHLVHRQRLNTARQAMNSSNHKKLDLAQHHTLAVWLQ